MPPQTVEKQFEFTGSAGGFFIMFLITGIVSIIPILGWGWAFNYQNKWITENVKINGKKVVYKAGLGEAIVLLLVGVILTLITFGIYTFWFVPKTYRFIASHCSFETDTPATPEPMAAPTPEAQPPTTDTTPVATPPAAPLVR